MSACITFWMLMKPVMKSVMLPWGLYRLSLLVYTPELYLTQKVYHALPYSRSACKGLHPFSHLCTVQFCFSHINIILPTETMSLCVYFITFLINSFCWNSDWHEQHTYSFPSSSPCMHSNHFIITLIVNVIIDTSYHITQSKWTSFR